MENLEQGAFVAVVLLAAVHVFAGRLHFLQSIPRSEVLSAASGVSVAYVFGHLLPELAEAQERIGEREVLPVLDDHVWLLALLGLTVFYGLERLSLSSRAQSSGAETSRGVFWLSTGSYAIYNALIGYLLLQREAFAALALFALAMGLHFFVNDYGLREHHKDRYTSTARWLLSAALFAGWLVGVATDVSTVVVVAMIAFVGGSIVMNVMKEELPEARQSRFWAFAFGAAGYALLLQLG